MQEAGNDNGNEGSKLEMEYVPPKEQERLGGILLSNLRRHAPELRRVLEEVNSEWCYEDRMLIHMPKIRINSSGQQAGNWRSPAALRFALRTSHALCFSSGLICFAFRLQPQCDTALRRGAPVLVPRGLPTMPISLKEVDKPGFPERQCRPGCRPGYGKACPFDYVYCRWR